MKRTSACTRTETGNSQRDLKRTDVICFHSERPPPYGENRRRTWKQVDQSGLEFMVAWTKVVAMGVMRNKFPNVFQRWYDLLIG